MGQLRRELLSLFIPFLVGWATKWAGEFEALDVSARAVGMGGAYLALADDPAAIYYNPAGTLGEGSRAVAFMHAENFEGVVKSDFLGGTHGSSSEGIGLALIRHGVSGIHLTQLPDTTRPPDDLNRPERVGEANAAWWTLYFNYSRRLGRAQLGSNLKAIYGQMGKGYSFGMGVDLGLRYAPTDGLAVGVRARNLTSSPLVWSTGTREWIIPRLGLGMAQRFGFGAHRLNLVVDLDLNFEGLDSGSGLGFGRLGIEEKLGVEYLFRDRLALRAGSYRGCLTLGVGGSYQGYYLDYAFQQGSFPNTKELGGSHKLSGGVRF